jgi:hypothetical protein
VFDVKTRAVLKLRIIAPNVQQQLGRLLGKHDVDHCGLGVIVMYVVSTVDSSISAQFSTLPLGMRFKVREPLGVWK